MSEQIVSDIPKDRELTKELVRDWLQSLARSQGFYGRLLRDLDEGDIWEDFIAELREHGVKEPLDMVMLIEG